MIVLAKQPTDDVTINITLNNSPDNLRIDESGTPVTFISITFANSSGGVNGWDIPQTINLDFTDNDIISGTIMSILTHITSSTDDEYMGIPNKNLMISLIDDDVAPCDQSGAVAENDFDPDIDGEDYGAGTRLDPYIICNADQLQAMRSSKPHLGAHYELGKDIDASSISTNTCPAGTTGTCTGFQPIGDCGADGVCGSSDDMLFKGTLDGKGFAIRDLIVNINLTSFSSYAGFFGFTDEATISNIGLLNVDISSTTTNNTSFAGGLVGRNENSSITNSYSTGNVSSFSTFTSYTGGLVGENIGSSITNSYSTGNVSSSATDNDSYAGGLLGTNSNFSSITNSYSTGNVSSSATDNDSYAGGLLGTNSNFSSITNSYSTGNVFSASSSAISYAGGLAGWNSSVSSITNSYYDLNTSGQTNIRGGGSGTLTCIGGFATDPFKQNVSGTGTCNNASPTIFFNWHEDMNSNRYDSNGDGMVDSSDSFVWNFGTSTEYPILASTPGTVDEQAVRMASGFLRFSNTTIGELSEDDFVFFYDIDDPAMDITTSGQNVQGTTAGNYVIEDAVDASGVALATPPTVTNAGVINGVNSLAANSEFYLKVTFTRGASPNTASYSHRYRFKK